MADAFLRLSGASWRGIPFPVARIRNSFAHGHVEHGFLYTDGCHIEATGRGPLVFHVTAPFHNGVRPGDAEGWAGQVLYPTLFGQFLKACLDRSSGIFLHPDLGPQVCKARVGDWDHDPTIRDGVTLTVHFVVSTDDGDDITGVIADQSPIGAATAAAANLDNTLSTTTAPLPELNNKTQTFLTMVDNYKSGTAGLGPIESGVLALSDALDRLDDVQYWPLRNASEQLRASVFDLRASPSQATSPVLIFTPTRSLPTTTLAAKLGVRTDDLVSLNPFLARDPLVPAGQRVRYLSPAR